MGALKQGALKTIWRVHTLPGLYSAIIRAAEDASGPCCNSAHPAWANSIPVTPLPREKDVSLSVLCRVGAASPVIVGVFLLWLCWLNCKYVLNLQHCLLQKGFQELEQEGLVLSLSQGACSRQQAIGTMAPRQGGVLTAEISCARRICSSFCRTSSPLTRKSKGLWGSAHTSARHQVLQQQLCIEHLLGLQSWAHRGPVDD